eukprot:m51a1_g5343 hypothetical protein (340) ;mRNA; r:438006-440029
MEYAYDEQGCAARGLSPAERQPARAETLASPADPKDATSSAALRPSLAPALCVTLSVGSAWLVEHGLSAEDVWGAGFRSAVYLEGDETKQLEPCSRCCKTRSSNVTLGVTDINAALLVDSANGRTVFTFDHCRSHCNSSRLHLGGKVVLGFELRSDDGRVAARVFSEPLSLCSKPSKRSSPPNTSAPLPRIIRSSPIAGTLVPPRLPIPQSVLNTSEALLVQPRPRPALGVPSFSLSASPVTSIDPLVAFASDPELKALVQPGGGVSVSSAAAAEESSGGSGSGGDNRVPLDPSACPDASGGVGAVDAALLEQLERFEEQQFQRLLQVRLLKEQLLSRM